MRAGGIPVGVPGVRLHPLRAACAAGHGWRLAPAGAPAPPPHGAPLQVPCTRSPGGLGLLTHGSVFIPEVLAGRGQILYWAGMLEVRLAGGAELGWPTYRGWPPAYGSAECALYASAADGVSAGGNTIQHPRGRQHPVRAAEVDYGALQSWCVSGAASHGPSCRGCKLRGAPPHTGTRRRGSASPATLWTRCSGRGRGFHRRAQEKVAAAAVPRFGDCSAASKPSPPDSWLHSTTCTIATTCQCNHATRFSIGLSPCIFVMAVVPPIHEFNT